MSININCLQGLKLSFKKKEKSKKTLKEQLTGKDYIEYKLENHQKIDLSNFDEAFLLDSHMYIRLAKSKRIQELGRKISDLENQHPSKILQADIYIILEKIYQNVKLTRKYSQSSYFYDNKVVIIDTFPLISLKNNFEGALMINREKDKYDV